MDTTNEIKPDSFDTTPLTDAEIFCPNCHAHDWGKTKLTKLQIISRFWFIFVLLAVPAAKYMPLMIIPALFIGGFCFIINQKRTNGNKIAQDLTCNKCNTSFDVPTKRGLELAAKEIEKETSIRKKKEAVQAEKKRIDRKNSRFGFGKINASEKIWKEFDLVSRRKSIYGSSRGKLKVTDQAILWYSTRNNERLAWQDITAIEGHTYFKIAPTGINIFTTKGKTEFIVPKKERNAVLCYLQSAFEKTRK